MVSKLKKGSTNSSDIEIKLIENLVSLQKIHTNLAERIDMLTKQISELLRLFEVAAVNFAKNPGNINSDKDKDFADKMNKLLDQNNNISRRISSLEEKTQKPTYNQSAQQQNQQVKEQSNEIMQPSISNRPLPKF